MFKLVHHLDDGAIIVERPTIADCWATLKTIAPETTPSVLWCPESDGDDIQVNFHFWFGPQPLVACGPFLVPLPTYLRRRPLICSSWAPDAPVAFDTDAEVPLCLLFDERTEEPVLFIDMKVDRGTVSVYATHRPRSQVDVSMHYVSPPPTLTSAALASDIMDTLADPEGGPLKLTRGNGRDLVLKACKL